MSLKNFYEQRYKTLLIIPFLLLLGAFLQIGLQYSATGDFVNRGITLKGGSTITIDYNEAMDLDLLQSFLNEQLPLAEVSVRTISSAGSIVSVAIDADAQESAEINVLLDVVRQKINLDASAIPAN